MKIPRSAKKFIDEEFKRHHEDRKREEKAFGKKTISYLTSVQDACSDLLHFGFQDLKKVKTITVTVQVELKNNEKWGHTVMSAPNIPNIFDKKKLNKEITAAGKRRKGGTML